MSESVKDKILMFQNIINTTDTTDTTDTKNINGNNHVYIVWSDENDYEQFEDHILGIYKNKSSALLAFQNFKEFTGLEHEIKCIDDIVENTIIENISTIQQDTNFHISRFKIKNIDTKVLYFLKIDESEGGGSYHRYEWFYVDENINDVCENMYWHYDGEHNRDGECRTCEKYDIDKCFERLCQRLKKYGEVDMRGSTYEEYATLFKRNIEE